MINKDKIREIYYLFKEKFTEYTQWDTADFTIIFDPSEEVFSVTSYYNGKIADVDFNFDEVQIHTKDSILFEMFIGQFYATWEYE